MSKIIAGSLVLLGGGTAVAGVVILPKWLNNVDAELPDKLNDFKGKRQEEGCIRSLFGEVTKLDNESANSISSSDIGSSPNSFFGGADKKTEGCLVVNWDKKTKVETGGNKWSGTFRFLWAVKGESKGFVVYLLGTTTKDSTNSSQKLSWSGVGYLLEHKESDGVKKWTEIKHAAVKSNAAFSGTETDTNKFPHPGTALDDLKDKNFWGFLSAVGDLQSIESEGQPTGDGVQNSSMRGYWTWEGKEVTGGGSSGTATPTKLMDWTKELEKWWKEAFDENSFKLKGEVENQQGSWTKRKYVTTPAVSDT